MKIALLGYGKMGKAIEAYCNEFTTHSIVLKINSSNPNDLTLSNLQKADVAIEFSQPELAIKHIDACFQANIPVVSGTTGWNQHLEKVKAFSLQEKKSFFYASNFSIGVQLFWKLIKAAGYLMNNFPTYQTSIDETHHIHKQDSPSGTAITTAELLISQMKNYQKWALEERENNILPIFAHRIDEVPGTHTVTFDSDIDTIKIEHSAKNRLGFVIGAVKAAEFLQHKVGVYSMDDLLKELK